jgi:hypothetical protein
MGDEIYNPRNLSQSRDFFFSVGKIAAITFLGLISGSGRWWWRRRLVLAAAAAVPGECHRRQTDFYDCLLLRLPPRDRRAL